MEDPTNRMKTYWKLTKATLGQNQTQNLPALVVNGITYTDDGCKANLLNDFFASQSAQTSIAFDENREVMGDSRPQLNSILVTNENILKILKSLNVNKACGIDGIGNNILKTCAESLVEPISILANTSIESECFPSEWKKANVVPVFKKNDKSCVTNYRPISLLSCPTKVI